MERKRENIKNDIIYKTIILFFYLTFGFAFGSFGLKKLVML